MQSALPPEAPDSPTRVLARFISRSQPDQLPPSVAHEAVRSMVNHMGCAIGGAGHESVDITIAALGPFAGAAQATIPGRREKTDCLLASLATGIASHVLDFDDTHPDVLVHPSGPVLAALWPLAEFRGAAGADLLAAFVAGVEVECRVARAVMPSHYDAGWHVTGTAGVLGAAAACARLLQLDEVKTAWALGIAATQAAGLRQMFGSMSKSLHVGRAAQGGLTAALLADKGFTSSAAPLEGAQGFLRVLSAAPRPEALTAGLGEDWELLRNTYKPYACGLVVHPAIDACIQLREAHGPASGAGIERIELVVHPLALQLTGRRNPASGLEAKFSVFHAAAVAILDGAGGEEQFSDTRAGIQLTHVPYKGSAPALNDVLAGTTPVMFVNLLSGLPHVKSGRLRVLAVATAARVPAIADVPTMAEAGVPGYEFQAWIGILAPAGTPAPVVQRLNAELGKVLAAPDVRDQLLNNGGMTILGGTPAQFADRISREMGHWRKLVQDTGAKAD